MLPWDTWGRGREIGPHARDVPEDLAAAIDAVARDLAGSPGAERAARVLREAPRRRRTPSIFTLAFSPGGPDSGPIETVPEDAL